MTNNHQKDDTLDTWWETWFALEAEKEREQETRARARAIHRAYVMIVIVRDGQVFMRPKTHRMTYCEPPIERIPWTPEYAHHASDDLVDKTTHAFARNLVPQINLEQLKSLGGARIHYTEQPLLGHLLYVSRMDLQDDMEVSDAQGVWMTTDEASKRIASSPCAPLYHRALRRERIGACEITVTDEKRSNFQDLWQRHCESLW